MELIPERASDLTYYHKNRAFQVKAGCIANQISEWEKITSDPEILSTVSGLPLNFSEEIDYKSSVTPSKFSPKEELFLLVHIKNLLRKGVKECQHEEGEYISPIFLTPKSDGSFRMILNFKKLNDHMLYIHFKTETIKSVLNLVTPSCVIRQKLIQRMLIILSRFYLNNGSS